MSGSKLTLLVLSRSELLDRARTPVVSFTALDLLVSSFYEVVARVDDPDFGRANEAESHNNGGCHRSQLFVTTQR